jgi:hypothetical protein
VAVSPRCSIATNHLLWPWPESRLQEVNMTDHLKIRRDGAVLEITFACREKKNALSNAMYLRQL